MRYFEVGRYLSTPEITKSQKRKIPVTRNTPSGGGALSGIV
jgi:hypothetical protein